MFMTGGAGSVLRLGQDLFSKPNTVADFSLFYFGRARSKGFATTLRNVSKLHLWDKIGHAKSVGFRFYSAI